MSIWSEILGYDSDKTFSRFLTRKPSDELIRGMANSTEEERSKYIGEWYKLSDEIKSKIKDLDIKNK